MQAETTSNPCAAAMAEVEACKEAVCTLKRREAESLARLEEAPEPHLSTNTIYVARYEAYLADRRALAEAMKKLDAARARLRAICCSSAGE